MAVLTDFDGTVAVEDASYAVLKRFAEGDWRDVEDEFYAGRISVPEVIRVQAGMVKAGMDEMSRFLIETSEIRSGFREFSDLCRERGIYLEICSDGFGFTIDVLLREWGLDWIPWTSNTVIPSPDGARIEFPYLREGCPVNANCKCSHMERLMREYDEVIFVGDGITDHCVSKIAKVVFARDDLARRMREEGRDFHSWETWDEISEYVLSRIDTR